MPWPSPRYLAPLIYSAGRDGAMYLPCFLQPPSLRFHDVVISPVTNPCVARQTHRFAVNAPAIPSRVRYSQTLRISDGLGVLQEPPDYGGRGAFVACMLIMTVLNSQSWHPGGSTGDTNVHVGGSSVVRVPMTEDTYMAHFVFRRGKRGSARK